MLGEVDHKIFKKLKVGLTCDPAKKDPRQYDLTEAGNTVAVV